MRSTRQASLVSLLLALACVGCSATSGAGRTTAAAGTTVTAAAGGASTSGGAGTGSSTARASERAAAASATACRSAPAPARWKHVVWVWFENKAYTDVLGSSDASYLSTLAHSCAVATDYHGVAHPSLPNYIAATSGSTHGITDDNGPQSHPLDGQSLFGQVAASGREWRSYEESMPQPCDPNPSGDYAPKHNPAAYYTALRQGQCARWDVSLNPLDADTRRESLPTFSLIVPNLCDDMHNCSVGTGDAWLRKVLPDLLDTPAYRSGDTAVFITFDEDDKAHQNRVPLIALAPSVRPGTTIGTHADHYSLLHTTEQLLGLPYLGAAASAPSLAGALGH